MSVFVKLKEKKASFPALFHRKGRIAYVNCFNERSLSGAKVAIFSGIFP